MNQTCTAHGFRRLGMIVRIAFVKPDGTRLESPKLDQLLEIYEARQPHRKKLRLSQPRQVGLELKHGTEEP